MVLVNILCQTVDGLRIRVTSHKSEAGDIRTEALNEIIERRGSKGNTYIVPEIMAVTARTPTGTVADIDSQRHLIGYLLKNNSCVYVFEHNSYSK
jgi:hypothetical protein